MKRRLKLIQFPLVILISILIPLLSGYLDYSDLADVDFPSRDKSFENPEQVDLLIDQQNELKLFASGFCSITLRPGIGFLEQTSRLTSQAPSSEQTGTFLRC